MAEKILLIQPRWMTEAMTRQKIEVWREKYPRAAFVLLSQAPIEKVAITNLVFPVLEAQNIAQFARKLRRTRFRRAIILSDAGHGDVGYGEARFWAFAANARWRELDGKPLTIWREAKAKKKVALILTVHGIGALCELFHVPRRVQLSQVEQEIWKETRTFIYLQHANHNHGIISGRVLLIGEGWSAIAARRCGWEIGDEKSDLSLVLSTKQEATIESRYNAKLWCFCEVKSPPRFETMREVENRAAFFDEDARDIWLVKSL